MTLEVEAKGLELRYGAVTALDDLRLDLTGGRIYGLLGRTGSGKTSLLSVLAGFRKASGGTVLIDRFQIPRRKKLGELSLGQRSALGMTSGRPPGPGDPARRVPPGHGRAVAGRLPRRTAGRLHGPPAHDRHLHPPDRRAEPRCSRRS